MLLVRIDYLEDCHDTTLFLKSNTYLDIDLILLEVLMVEGKESLAKNITKGKEEKEERE